MKLAAVRDACRRLVSISSRPPTESHSGAPAATRRWKSRPSDPPVQCDQRFVVPRLRGHQGDLIGLHVRRIDRQDVHPAAQPPGQRVEKVALVDGARGTDVAAGAGHRGRIDVRCVQVAARDSSGNGETESGCAATEIDDHAAGPRAPRSPGGPPAPSAYAARTPRDRHRSATRRTRPSRRSPPAVPRQPDAPASDSARPESRPIRAGQPPRPRRIRSRRPAARTRTASSRFGAPGRTPSLVLISKV